MTSLFSELPDAAVPHRLFASGEFGKGDFEVEVGQQLFLGLCLHGLIFLLCLIAHFLIGPAQPVAAAPDADRRLDRVPELVEMPDGALGIIQL